VTVLRDGRLVAARPLAGLGRLDLVGLMLGKSFDEVRRGTTGLHRHAATDAVPIVRGTDLRRGRKLNGVTVEARRGEIVGIAGLLGSGRSETARALFGLDEIDSGEVRFDGKAVALRSPRDAIAAGMAFLAEDRKAEGIIPGLSVRENLTLAALPLLTRMGIVSGTRQRELVNRFMTRMRIKASPEQDIRELSGGNQQKVLLARWLVHGCRVLLLDEPTRGVDVGARTEIYALIRRLADAGTAIVVVSSEIEEVLGLSDRVMVIAEGRVLQTTAATDITEHGVLDLIMEGVAA